MTMNLPITERLCIVCGAKATKKVILDTETATHIMYHCAEHAAEAMEHKTIAEIKP